MAISTTGDEHRMGFLETCVRAWDQVLPPQASLFVTVDGNAADVRRAAEAVKDYTESVYQVGQAGPAIRRHGVAINKNTGIELLMDSYHSPEHLFLCDDDTWPLYPESLAKHIEFDQRHSMVCWGKSRLTDLVDTAAVWSWPRGVMLYMHHSVITNVGGMDERFGPGGHEHAEYSQRIYHTGITSHPFVSPLSYSTRNAMGARALWHAEDMPQPGELGGTWLSRKRHNTTITHDWATTNKIMAERQGSAGYVPFRAHENGRASATLCADLTSQGAEGQE